MFKPPTGVSAVFRAGKSIDLGVGARASPPRVRAASSNRYRCRPDGGGDKIRRRSAASWTAARAEASRVARSSRRACASRKSRTRRSDRAPSPTDRGRSSTEPAPLGTWDTSGARRMSTGSLSKRQLDLAERHVQQLQHPRRAQRLAHLCFHDSILGFSREKAPEALENAFSARKVYEKYKSPGAEGSVKAGFFKLVENICNRGGRLQ